MTLNQNIELIEIDLYFIIYNCFQLLTPAQLLSN